MNLAAMGISEGKKKKEKEKGGHISQNIVTLILFLSGLV